MNHLLDRINNKNNKILFLAIGLFACIGLGFVLLGYDMQMLLRWNLALFVLGICVLPLNSFILKYIGRSSYFFSRIVGFVLISYIVWILSRLKLVAFGVNSIFITVVIVFWGSFIYIFCKYYKRGDYSAFKTIGKCIGTDFETIIFVEIVVLLIHVLTTWILGMKIPGNGTERLMDLSFMITLDNTKYMAPVDVWASGHNINYYYFGQYMMTFISKMAFVDVRYGYSLAISMIMTFCIVGIYILTYNLIKLNKTISNKLCIIGGIIGAVAVSLCGNCHYIVFYMIVPTLRKILMLPEAEYSYWFPNSTRYIGYIPENTLDRTISEFPIYSFIIGDLHAHVIDITLVLLLLGCTLSYCIKKKVEKEDGIQFDKDRNVAGYIAELLNVNIIMLGVFIGIASMTNYWDYLIYFVVCGALVLTANVYKYGLSYISVAATFLQGAIVYVVSWIVNILFMIQFDKMINGIGIVNNRSYVHQLLILWGLPIALVIILIVRMISEQANELNSLEISDCLVLTIGFCAIGLVFIPEIVFVKDIYIDGAPRANTMFKLTYQAFILFGITIGYIIVRFISTYIHDSDYENSKFKIFYYKKMPILCIVLWILTLGYPVTSVRMWMGDYKTLSYKGIDAASSILEKVPEEKSVLEWIDSNIDRESIILTRYGDSYTDTCIISALSGRPTVLGWITHEWLWHNDYEFCRVRETDINEIYEGNDLNSKYELCEKYNLDYIYIGSAERENYPDINMMGLQEIGDIVYYDSNYGTYIFKVK